MWRDLSDLGIYTKKPPSLPHTLRDPSAINTYFSSVSGNDADPSPDVLKFYGTRVKPGVGIFSFVEILESEVERIVLGFSSNSYGTDGISVKMLHLCCPIIIPFLTHVFNFCIVHGVYPSIWKEARVVPIPKNNRPTTITDLRPISILPVMSRIFERILERQLSKHINNFHILPSFQSGFRPGYSCTTALTNIIDDIMSATDKGLVTVLALLDFSKAFDSINHRILISILNYIGFDARALCLFESYLVNRRQQVVIDTSYSDFATLKCGIPQGSILGPILFSIYTSHLLFFQSFSSSFHFYADDTQLYKSFDTDGAVTAVEDMNRDLGNILEIANKHCLSINENKSCFVVFGSNLKTTRLADQVNLFVDGVPLTRKSCVKNLGLFIDEHLRFGDNTNFNIRRAYCNLKMIFPHRHSTSTVVKKLLCDALVLSHFNYCDSIYGHCLHSNDARRIQVVQNSCLRFVFGIRRRQPISHKLTEIQWLNMARRRSLHFACFVHKIINDSSPPYLTRKIRYRTDVHSINIRRKDMVDIPAHFTQQFKRSFRYNCAKTVNGLPLDVHKFSRYTFKLAIKKFLFDEQTSKLA